MSLPNPLYTPFNIHHDMGMIAIYTLRRHHTHTVLTLDGNIIKLIMNA